MGAVSFSNRPLLQQPPSPYNDPLLFVIPSAAERICGSADLSWKCFSVLTSFSGESTQPIRATPHAIYLRLEGDHIGLAHQTAARGR